MAFSVRAARPDELDLVMDFYDLMIDQTAGTDNDPLWVRGIHPNRDAIAAGIEAGEVFLGLCNDELAGALVLDHDQATGYEQVPWQVQAAPEEVAVIHLFGIRDEFRGRGFGFLFLQIIQQIARDRGAKVIRLDVLRGLSRAIGLYRKAGFVDLGPATLTYEDPRVTDFEMFELVL